MWGGEKAVIRLAWDEFAGMSSATYESRNMSSNKRSPLAAQAQRLFALLNPYSITGASLLRLKSLPKI